MPKINHVTYDPFYAPAPPVLQAEMSLLASEFNVNENSPYAFTIRRSVYTSQRMSVNWAITNANVTPASGTVTFEIGDTDKTVSVTTGEVGPTEVGQLTLSNPQNLDGGQTPILVAPFIGTFTVYDTDAGFPLFTVYSNIVNARGGTPVPQSNTRYWSKPVYPVYDVANPNHYLETVGSIQARLNVSAPGDVIFLTDGEYNNLVLDMPNSGNSVDQITLAAQTRGGVNCTGDTRLQMSGNFLNLYGIDHRDTVATNSPYGLVYMIGDDNMTAFCTFDNATKSTISTHTCIGIMSHFRGVPNYRNRACYNTFQNITADGQCIRSWPAGGGDYQTCFYARLDHNKFSNNSSVLSPLNNFATYYWGERQSHVQTHLLFDNNYIYRHNNDGLGTNYGRRYMNVQKSGYNIHIQNVWLECQGWVYHRHSHRATMYANYFLGNGYNATAGIEMNGDEDWVFCNYFKDLNHNNQFGWGVFLKSGDLPIPPEGSSGYYACKDNEISHNTFINTNNTIGLGFGGLSGDPAVDNSFYNNAIDRNNSGGNSIEEDVGDWTPSTFSWDHNVIETPQGIEGEPGSAGRIAATPQLSAEGSGPGGAYYVPTAGGNCDGTVDVNNKNAVCTVDILGNVIPSTNANVGCFQDGWDVAVNDPVQAIIDEAGADTTSFPLFDVYTNIMNARGYAPVPASLTYYWEWQTKAEALAAYPTVADTTETTIANLNTAIAAANPGDVIFLQDGIYNNANIVINVSGTAANRITVASQTKHGAKLRLDSSAEIHGDYIDFFGFDWGDTNNDNLNVIDLDGCQYTRSAFHRFANMTHTGYANTVRLHIATTVGAGVGAGYGCRICFNDIDGLDDTFQVARITSINDAFWRFDHNRIVDLRGNPALDDMEYIQWGGGTVGPDRYPKCLTDNNYIYRHNNDGAGNRVVSSEDECHANKSSGNVFIRNVYENCCSAPNDRSSNFGTYYANFVLAGNVESSSGINGAGDQCWMFCNYIENSPKRGLLLRTGGADQYQTSINGEYSFNTVYNCSTTLAIGQLGNGGGIPDNNSLYNNALSKPPARPQTITQTLGQNTTYQGNVVSTPVGVVMGGVNTEAEPDLAAAQNVQLPTNGGNCDGTARPGYSALVTVDIMGNPLGANPNVGCFQVNALSVVPYQTIIDEAGN